MPITLGWLSDSKICKALRESSTKFVRFKIQATPHFCMYIYHPFAAWDSNLIPSARESRGKGLCRAAERIDFSQGKITSLQWHARHVFDSNQCALVARLLFCWLIQEMQNYLVPGSIDLQAIFFLSFRDQNLCWEKSAYKQGVKGHIETNLIKRLNTLTHSLALRKSL